MTQFLEGDYLPADALLDLAPFGGDEAAALRGREDRFTPAELGRKLPTVLPGLFVNKVLDLVADAIGIEPVTGAEDDGKKKQDPAKESPTGA